MPISQIPIFSMLRTRLQWHQERQRLLAENVANANTPKFTPRDLAPPEFNRMRAAPTVSVAQTDPGHMAGSSALGGGQFQLDLGPIRTDPSEFRMKHMPGHPAADANGNVKYPNVNPLIEMTDMREAQRSYEANLNVIGATRRMIQRTLDILKA